MMPLSTLLISSSLSSYHTKAGDALSLGRVQTRLGVALVPSFQVEFSSDFFNLLLARFYQAEIIIMEHLIQGRNNRTRSGVESLIFRSWSS